MPLPGGPSDKFGNRYELWWTVSQLARILHGGAESLRIEDPNVTKAEFVVVSGGRRELHQAKRSHQDGKWSLTSLASSEVRLLQGVFAELSGNDARFIFVSGSDAVELRELSSRAQDAETVAEFESRFLDAKAQKANFEKLRKCWNGADVATAYEILRRIEVRTVDETSLKDQVRWSLRALFLADTDHVLAELRCVADDSVHKTVTRNALVDRLAKRGYTLRRLARIEAAPALIGELTSRYLARVQNSLIGKSLIPRAATRLLLERILGTPQAVDCVLTGKAGSGKTVCATELVEKLLDQGVPVLAFRLDNLDPVSTTAELGQRLLLEESPVLVLAAAAEGREAVLVVDQLDALSTASGRSSDAIDAVDALLAESRGLRDRLKLHVVVVCRAFDWANDHRLRRLLSDKTAKVEVTEFSVDEVKNVLSAEGFNPELLQPRQLELLRLPQNLALFSRAGFTANTPPQFATAKDLFDRYWDEKRRATVERAAPSPDCWMEVIRVLCDEMTHTQQLSVPREKLDPFPPDFLRQMSSEGVLTFDGRRYGFAHESFFDYCFARAFVATDQTVSHFLKSSQQHLFRRAQVRQVLAYLRDADRQRYATELRALLTDDQVRTHIRDLALAVLMSVPDPGDDEWEVIEPWLNLGLADLTEGREPPDPFAGLVWHHFFASSSWFHLADRRGLICDWLTSNSENLINVAVNYLRLHQRHSGDRVAELLEPFAATQGLWRDRLRFFMDWVDYGNSRRFFDLFLRLIDEGTLDDEEPPTGSKSAFWSKIHGLRDAPPEWLPEAISHWLRRRFVLTQMGPGSYPGAKPDWSTFFIGNDIDADQVRKSSVESPRAFVEHVLPAILEITDAAACGDVDRPPRYAALWLGMFGGGRESAGEVCRNALGAALGILAASQPDKLGLTIAELKSRDTNVANSLLLNLYKGGANQFADEAVALLCDQTWRFDCCFSDSRYWVATELIRAVAPVCSPENRARLETAILGYSSEYERSKEGYKKRGWACFSLLSGVPPELRSSDAQARYKELERKFGRPPGPPAGVQTYWVGSPIDKTAAEKMNDEQWLTAIAKYHSEERIDRWEHPEKGGAWELAGTLSDLARGEPDRFARLCLRFPLGTNPVYLKRSLDGLKGTTAPTPLKLEVCLKAYRESRLDCGQAIADLLGSIEEPLPTDAVRMLDWLACEHPDPERESWEEESRSGGGDILTHGINTTRGRAAEAIRDLIVADEQHLESFRNTLDCLVNDKSLCVRACVASTLIAVGRRDVAFAVKLFTKLAACDERLLGTPYVERFIAECLRHRRFVELRPYVEQMLRLEEPKGSAAGARLACLAGLYQEHATDLIDEAMAGDPAQRLGVAQVAAANIAHEDCRSWCEERLLVFFNDGDDEVRREAASCFRHLKNEPLEGYDSLIGAFCDSEAYKTDSFAILHMLEESLQRLPGTTCVVCEKFLNRFSSEARDTRTHRAGDVHMVVKLIFRTYQQHQHDEWAPRCLDLIDKLCLAAIRDARTELEEYER